MILFLFFFLFHLNRFLVSMPTPTSAAAAATVATKNREQQPSTIAVLADQHNILHNSNELSASPLKIESVTPAFGKHINRSMHRSYSTLSVNYLKRITTTAAAAAAALEERPNVPSSSEQQQQSRSKQINDETATTNGVGNTNGTSNSNGNGSHGFWRIQRTFREKEKLPDRINLDRRGLTTLPIIDNEPNLRLLSLQHNLINSLCVPAAAAAIDANASQSNDDTVKRYTGHGSAGGGARVSIKSNAVGHRQLATTAGASNRRCSGVGTLRTQSIQKPSSSSSSMASAASRTIFMHNKTTAVAASHALARQNSHIAQKSMLHAPGTGVAAATAAAARTDKFVLKKSNSFITNYSRHLVATKAHLGRLIQTRTNGKALRAIGGTMSSFSSDSTADIDTKSAADMLIVNSDPFANFADSLQNLVFLDLYDNQIERISNLDGLRSLTVLLLGKNRIVDIAGIVSVKRTLRVLDLHGNKITNITQKICQLQELKSLNLAGNSLRSINCDDFKGLVQLKELNLKRNKIKKMAGFDDLRCLERLWLCHNDLQRVEDMSAIAKAINLREVTLESNPVSLGGDCVSFLVSYLPHLSLLSQMQVTEQVRRAAMAWRRNKELSDANYSHLSSDVCQTIRREEVISNARTNWELLRTQQPVVKSAATFIQKTLADATKQMPNTADVTSDAYSVLSDNVMVDRKLLRQKTQMIRKNLKRPVIAAIKRSLSQENPSKGAAATVDTPEFRLPPITVSTATIDASDAEPIPENNNVYSSASSVGANVDSMSSHFQSDNESAVIAKEVNVPSPLQRSDPNIRNCEEPSVIPSDAEVPEKVPNISTSMATTSARPPAPAPAMADAEKNHSSKCKSASQTRRPNGNQLLRAQTVRVSSPCATPVLPNGAINCPPSATKPHKSNVSDREREQGGDYLIEICGRYLNVYGSGAIKFVDRQWNAQKANDVNTLKFSYVNFNSIAAILGRVKNRFPSAEHIVFRETNISALGQLNALAEIQGIVSVTIEAEGNPICTKSWRLYAVYRLAHWGVKTINDAPVTEQEIDDARQAYAGLSDLVLWSLPDALIEPLLLRLHLDETCTASKMTAKQWLMSADESLRIVVGKEALQCRSVTAAESDTRYRGRQCLATMITNTYSAVEKLQQLEQLWPTILLDLIKNALMDYAQMDAYLSSLMSDIDAPNENKIK